MSETVLQYQENCYTTEDPSVCQHYLLEEHGVPDEEVVCERCETNRTQRVADVVERTTGDYTTAYPCMTMDGQGHIVPHLYDVCPHCKTPKKDHLIHLVRELAKSLMGSDVPEVKVNPKARDPIDFDARLFVSGAATAYPQLYQATLQDWMVKTQASDLCGEVIAFITPVKSMHFNRCCELSCSNYGQSEISRLAVDAFDYKSVHGTKPKVWVQLTRTARVKTILVNNKK